jgi:tRNA(Arg) A34 adenosine deaminase TadA
VHSISRDDAHGLRLAIAAAVRARKNGNHPFGAVLADSTSEILLEAENTVVSEHDCTAHAELNLIRRASRRYDRQLLSTCTLYASTEPCPMCSGGIYWSGVGRVVYGLSQSRFYEMVGRAARLELPCRDVFAAATANVRVVGPLLEDEAVSVHEDFWQTEE